MLVMLFWYWACHMLMSLAYIYQFCSNSRKKKQLWLTSATPVSIFHWLICVCVCISKYLFWKRKVKYDTMIRFKIKMTTIYYIYRQSILQYLFNTNFVDISLLFKFSDSSISTRVDMLTPAIEVYKPPLWQKDETVDSHLGNQSTSSDL